jgi:hypothetical protein
MNWLIFLPQLPASPSTLRVMVWRRMRDAGALGLQNGVWLLPDRAPQSEAIQELRVYLQEHQASCHIFRVSALEASDEEDILARLRADRDEEYAEFIERCDVLLDDLAQETKAGKFSFAELEEAEVDLTKLDGWWEKCSARDFVTGLRRAEAQGKLDSCRAAYDAFAAQVYAKHGVETAEEADQ